MCAWSHPFLARFPISQDVPHGTIDRKYTGRQECNLMVSVSCFEDLLPSGNERFSNDSSAFLLLLSVDMHN